jgi:methylmalonyl-CoA/ethylmalonyl-CoA epimerase
MPETELHLSHIGQIAMPVHDIGRAVRFYRDVLGLPFLFEAPPSLAFFDCDGVRLMLSVPETAEYNHPGSILYFSVPDIRHAWRTLSARGARMDNEPHMVAKLESTELWLCTFHDGERNTLALMSEVKTEAPASA